MFNTYHVQSWTPTECRDYLHDYRHMLYSLADVFEDAGNVADVPQALGTLVEVVETALGAAIAWDGDPVRALQGLESAMCVRPRLKRHSLGEARSHGEHLVFGGNILLEVIEQMVALKKGDEQLG